MNRTKEIFKEEKNWEEAAKGRRYHILRNTLDNLNDYNISNRDKERIKRQTKNNFYKR